MKLSELMAIPRRVVIMGEGKVCKGIAQDISHEFEEGKVEVSLLPFGTDLYYKYGRDWKEKEGPPGRALVLLVDTRIKNLGSARAVVDTISLNMQVAVVLWVPPGARPSFFKSSSSHVYLAPAPEDGVYEIGMRIVEGWLKKRNLDVKISPSYLTDPPAKILPPEESTHKVLW